MITFNVVKERHGWAIRLGERMTTPFRSRDLAVQEPNRLADTIRGHGEHTEVNVETADQKAPGSASEHRGRRGPQPKTATLQA